MTQLYIGVFATYMLLLDVHRRVTTTWQVTVVHINIYTDSSTTGSDIRGGDSVAVNCANVQYVYSGMWCCVVDSRVKASLLSSAMCNSRECGSATLRSCASACICRFVALRTQQCMHMIYWVLSRAKSVTQHTEKTLQ
jgi:hypothetical protein